VKNKPLPDYKPGEILLCMSYGKGPKRVGGGFVFPL
jgi:hypothetical protein